jgi:hypothetical protein
MDRLRRAMDSGDDEALSDRDGRESKELRQARRELKSAMIDKAGSSKEEQQRIAGILQRATAEILAPLTG